MPVYDVKKQPAILFSLIIVIILLFSLYYNFIIKEYVHYDVILEERRTENHGRLSNIKKKNIDNNGLIKILDHNISGCKGNDDNVVHTNHDIYYIIGKSTIPDYIDNNIIVKLDSDEIYTVSLDPKRLAGITLNLWNDSNESKNLKTIGESSFIPNRVFGSKFITLKPRNIITITSDGKDWIHNYQSLFILNEDLVKRYLSSQVDLIINSNMIYINNNITNIDNNTKKLIDIFNERITHKILNNDLHSINTTIDNYILSVIEEESYNLRDRLLIHE
jgi:hypothetical protein